MNTTLNGLIGIEYFFVTFNLLQPLGPVQAFIGIALPYVFHQTNGQFSSSNHKSYYNNYYFLCRWFRASLIYEYINHLTPNDPFSGRTATLTSKRCILYIYSTNTSTEYFKHLIYSPFFSSKYSLFHNSNVFGSYIIQILYTECAKIKKKIIPAPQG